MKLFFGHDQDGKLLAVDGRWVDTKGAAQYYGFSPATLRKKRSEQGKDGPFVWVKLGGKVLYDLFVSSVKYVSRSSLKTYEGYKNSATGSI